MNIDSKIPIKSVTPKPLIDPVPKMIRTIAAITVVMLLSKIATIAF
ncbi:MAG: hypothetical protein ACLUSP_03550 [Christensenellales bacterium]